MLRYGDGLPIEQTRRRRGAAIEGETAAGIEEDCTIRAASLLLLSCPAPGDFLCVCSPVVGFGDEEGFGDSFLRRRCVIEITPQLFMRGGLKQLLGYYSEVL